MRLGLSERYGRRRVLPRQSRSRHTATAFALVVKSAGARLGALLVGLMIIAGCNGSSNNSLVVSTATPTPPPTATATPSPTPTFTPSPTPTIVFNGSAFQGAVITNETVLAYAVNPVDGSNRAFLGETIADSTGNFNLNLATAPSGPMRLVSTGGNLMSVVNGAAIGTPADLSALFASASTSIANISINPLSAFVDTLTQGNLRVPGSIFATAFAGAAAKIDSVYGLTADPATITPDYTGATVGTDAGNLGLILGAMINEDQYLCPPAAGTLVTSLAADIADGVFDGLNFGSPIGYCGGDLAPLAGITAMQDALSGLAQFGLITQGFAFGGKGNVLTQNGLANLAVNGTKAYPLTPLTTIETALAKAAPVPKNSFAPAAQTATMNVGRFLHTATLLPNGQVLLAGGIGQPNGVLASSEIYDPPTNSFLPPGATPTMNVARTSATATLLPGGGRC